MKRKRKTPSGTTRRPRSQYWLIVLFAALVVLILLLRMAVFVAGRGRHRF
jgi:uncharacterized membrane protein YhaH (DUF805 family)